MRIHSIKGLIDTGIFHSNLFLEKQDQVQRFKLGLAWTAINPAIMICIYL